MMLSPRVRLFLLASLLLLVLAQSFSFAEETEILVLDEEKPAEPKKPDMSIAPDTEPVPVVPTYSLFYEKWTECVQAMQNGESSAGPLRAQILEMKKGQKIPAFTSLALSSVQLGQKQLKEKNPKLAIDYFQFAEKLDPSLAEAYYAESRAHIAGGLGGIISAIRSGIQGFFAPRKNLRGQVFFESKITSLVVATLLLAAVAFAAIMLLKYNALLRHDAEEKYGKERGPVLTNLVVWTVLFLPLFLFIGPLWLAPFWIMMLIRYMRTAEKIIAIALMAAFLVAHPLYRKITEKAELLQDPTAVVYGTVFSEGPSPKAIQDLQKYLKEHPDDRDAAILLASLFRRDNKLEEATDQLQQIIAISQQEARAPNNLAEIFFSRGELDYALRLAQKAAEIDGRNAIYKFNLSNIYRAKFNFNEANSYMEQARSMNRSLVQNLEESFSEKVVEVVPTAEILEQRSGAKGKGFLSFMVNPFTILAVLLLAASVYFGFFAEKPKLARECVKCGKPFCRKCQPNTKVPGFCTAVPAYFCKKGWSFTGFPQGKNGRD